MSYSNLSDALNDLETKQVRVELNSSGEHKVSLSVCTRGLAFIFGELAERFDESALMEICPVLASVSAGELVCALLSGDEPEDILENILDSIDSPKSSSSSKTTILDNPKIGDKIASSREVMAVTGYSYDKRVQYKDQNGKLHWVMASSWKGFGKNKTVTRK